MSQLALAILNKVQETVNAEITRLGVLVISTENLFLASGEAGTTYLEGQRYCEKLGIWVLA